MTLQLTKIRQRFERPYVPNVPEATQQALEQVTSLVQPGARVAVAVGSRGVANIANVVKTVVTFLKSKGADPFIVPAMGSHGGATAEGQAAVLASYGITATTMGMPVRSSLETVELTKSDSLNRVFMDRLAYEADGVVLINRVKPHTDFHGTYESGLVKLSVIGLGKHQQALEIHSFGVYGLRELIPPTAQQILETGKILFGVALVENAYDETMRIEVLRAEEIMAEEPRLLDLARAHMPKLPVDKIDVLMIDRMGKDISGAGIDPNIIGRNKIWGEPEPESPQIRAIVVDDLTLASHGNAVGIGLADVVTQRLVDKIDWAATYENTVTSTFLERGKLPVVASTDAQAYAYARRSCGRIPASQERIARIQDTLHLSEVYVSQAILDDIKKRSDIDVIGEPRNIFDGLGASLL